MSEVDHCCDLLACSVSHAYYFVCNFRISPGYLSGSKRGLIRKKKALFGHQISNNMTRANDIKEKLAFTLLKYQSLMVEIGVAQKEDKDVSFIGQKVGDILSGCRECFDYCARDMADAFITTSANRKLVGEYAQGKKRAYFPFSHGQLVNGSLFFELSKAAPLLYQHLLELASKIETKKIIPNTNLSYDISTAINDLVNSKKHDKITKSICRQNSATHITFPNGETAIVSPLFPVYGDRPDFGEDISPQSFVATEGVVIKYVKEYKLSHNNWEVCRFSLHSILSTSRILAEIYQNYFAMPSNYFDPWETAKPENIRQAEEAVRNLSPIVNRPLRIVLLIDDVVIVNNELSFEGEVVANNRYDIALVNLFLLFFEIHFVHTVNNKICELVFHKWETFVGTPRYCEIDQVFTNAMEITLDGHKKVRFNRILWGIGSKFCCHEFVARQPDIGVSTKQALIAIANGTESYFSLLTDESGKVLNCEIES